LKYETAVKSGKYVLIAHGSDVKRFMRVKSSAAQPEALQDHQACSTKEACAVGA